MSIIQTIVQTSDLFFELTSNQENLDIRTLIGNTLYNANYRKRVIIPSSVTVGSPSTGAAAMQIPTGLGGELVIDNYGSIQGAGGAAGGTGGDAILAQSACRVNNKPTGTIYAGGGGGGTGGTGGAGGSGSYSVPGPIVVTGSYIVRSCSTCGPGQCPPAPTGGPSFAGCSPSYPAPNCTTSGTVNTFCNSYGASPPVPVATSGGTGGVGGSGGVGRGYNQSPTTGAAGDTGAAGGTNAGTGGFGGTGGTGGDWGTTGDTGNTGATGSNGNSSNGLTGSAGGSGGDAGYYINGLSTYVTLSNNGTVAGRTN
jgi:hypothetical protein